MNLFISLLVLFIYLLVGFSVSLLALYITFNTLDVSKYTEER